MSFYFILVLIGYVIFIELMNWMFRKYTTIMPFWFGLFVALFVVIRFFTFIPRL